MEKLLTHVSRSGQTHDLSHIGKAGMQDGQPEEHKNLCFSALITSNETVVARFNLIGLAII
jgi:hypothetical protein